jgi:hypothetical protein
MMKKAGIPVMVLKSFASRLANKFSDISTMLRELQMQLRD